LPRQLHHRPPRDRSVESELKFRVEGARDHKRVTALLRKLRARREGEYEEENFRFQGPGKTTRRTTLRLRVLDGGPKGVLTAKGPAQFLGGVKVREETEVQVADAHATLDLLMQLGFQVYVVYRKHRTVWVLDKVNVTLDVLDFGHFVEVEGPLEVIPEVARSLGLEPAKAVKDSYSIMARKHETAARKAAKKATPATAAATSS
jgi:predicted adenylyl cyclase CyaB